MLTQEQVTAIGHIDVLMLPMGGNCTIDAEKALEVKGQLNPAITVPMHYRTEACNFPIDCVDKFTDLVVEFQKIEKQEIDISKKIMDDFSQVVILNYE